MDGGRGDWRVRYGAGVSTFSWRVRLAVTLPPVLLTLFVLRQVVLWFLETDMDSRRVGALWFFVFAVTAAATWLWCRAVWTPSAEWSQEQHRIRQAAERENSRERVRAPNPSIHGIEPPE